MDRLFLRISRFCPSLLRERAFAHRWCLVLWEVFPVSSMLSLSLVGASCAWTSAESTEQSWVQAVVWHNVSCTLHRMGTAVCVQPAGVQRGSVCGGPGRWLIQGPADFDVQNICSAAGAPTPLGDKLWWLHSLMASDGWQHYPGQVSPGHLCHSEDLQIYRLCGSGQWKKIRSPWLGVRSAMALSWSYPSAKTAILLLKPSYVPDLGLEVDLSPFST